MMEGEMLGETAIRVIAGDVPMQGGILVAQGVLESEEVTRASGGMSI